MVVTIAQYFSPEHFTIYPFIAFITIFFLFGTYTVLINKAINPNQKARGFILMYSHFFSANEFRDYNLLLEFGWKERG